MRLRSHTRRFRTGATAPLTIAAAVLATVGIAPIGDAQAQAMPDYPTGSGIPLPGPTGVPSGVPTGTPSGTGPESPVARRGALGWWTEASITGQATLTNNANYGESTVREGDLILELIPALRFNREGARLRVNGAVSLDMLHYVDGTQTDRILPQVDILANLEAVENLFFIDASVVANQAVSNPFLPRAEFSSTNNQYTYTLARLVPYLQGQIGQNVSWLVRSDNSYTWTTQTDDPLNNAYYASHLVQVTRNPTPFGLTLRASRDLTRIQNQLQPDQTLDTALAIFDYAVSPQLTVGLRGGYENTTYTAEETAGPIYGANINWRPSPTLKRGRLLGAALLRAELSVAGLAPAAAAGNVVVGVPDDLDLSAGAAADSVDQQRRRTAGCDPDGAIPRSDHAAAAGQRTDQLDRPCRNRCRPAPTSTTRVPTS